MRRMCTQYRCKESADALVVESDPLDLLINSGAGFFCQKHADDLARFGGVIVSLKELALAAERTEGRQ